ncbi:hypothetical protein M5K25_017247 [Dendrobium thyrsiflorum]|uniref:CCHC-type domain-containing protein n=1 Tax=Dendrobium thyrsiflorum TaxID=117978 RepID=A0ABD0UTL9_DENTH
MARRKGRRLSPNSGGGSGGKFASKHGNYWKVLEGKELDVCEQVLLDEQGMHMIFYVGCSEGCWSGSASFILSFGFECFGGEHGWFSSCKGVDNLNASAQEPINIEQCTSDVCGNISKEISVNLEAVGDDYQSPSTKQHSRGPGHFSWRKPSYMPLDKILKEEVLEEDGICMSLNLDKVQENISKLECALVGKLLGKRISFAWLHSELSRRCLDARDIILRGGPWIVAGSIIGLDRWSRSFSLDDMKGFASPIWVWFPRLPLMYWDPSNIARMAAMVGEPLWMDEQSLSWGQSYYARVCVRIDLTQKLSSGFWIKGLNGRFFQRVEYEGLSHLCFHCGFIGHKVESCPLKTKLQPDSHIDYTLPSTDMEVQNIAIPISTQHHLLI